MTARGIRNNNPGNLRHSEQFAWDGETDVDPQGFVIFDSALHGIRALARDLRNKIRRGLDTVESMISVFAPSSENDTVAYIQAVCVSTGYTPNASLLPNQPTLCALVKAITLHENGSCPYSDQQIADGVHEALV